MSQIKPSIITSYLSALRSYHVDRRISTTVFDSPHLLRLVQGARSLFPGQKRERLPITRDILLKITPTLTTRDEQQVDAAFKLAFTGFLRMGEFTHAKAKEKNSTTFVTTSLTRSDITIAADHAIIRLKRSKTDKTHQGVSILVASIGDSCCPVQALKDLIQSDPQPPTAPLFRFDGGGFLHDIVIKILKTRLQTANILGKFNGHSFRRGAAQHAKNNDLLDEHI